MSNKISAVEWLIEQVKSKEWQDKFIWHKEEVFEQTKAMEKDQNGWNLVKENKPTSGIELLVQSPEGVNHLASWRESYNIFTCQDKRESSKDWKWKYI